MTPALKAFLAPKREISEGSAVSQGKLEIDGTRERPQKKAPNWNMNKYEKLVLI